MSYQLAIKWCPLISACCIESQRSIFHSQSITGGHNYSITQYNNANITDGHFNPFAIELSANGSILVFLFNVALSIAVLWILGVDNHVGLFTVYVTWYIWHDAANLFYKSQTIKWPGNLWVDQKQIYSILHITIMPIIPAHPSSKDCSSENIVLYYVWVRGKLQHSYFWKFQFRMVNDT